MANHGITAQDDLTALKIGFDGHPLHWPPKVTHPFTDERLELARLGLPPLADDEED